MSIDMKTKETPNKYYCYSESRKQEEKQRGRREFNDKIEKKMFLK